MPLHGDQTVAIIYSPINLFQRGLDPSTMVRNRLSNPQWCVNAQMSGS